MNITLLSNRSGFTISIFMLIAAVHFLYATTSVLPTVYPDEIGYLMNAAAIAGYKSDIATQYFAGYSLLLSPVFLYGGSPEAVYLFVKLINTGLFVGAFIALYKLVRRLLPQAGGGEALMAVAVVSFYPAFLIFNALAMSESAYIFIFILTALLAVRLREPSVLQWAAFGVGVGLLFMIHPKSGPVVLSAALVGVYLAVTEKRYVQFAVFLFVVALSVLLALQLNTLVKDALTISTIEYDATYPAAETLAERIFSWHGVVATLGNLAGQTLYLIAGSIGAVMFGVAVAFRHLKKGEAENAHVWVFLLLSLGGTMIVSAMFLDSSAGGARLDHVFYGRYNEGVLAPLMVVGLMSAPRNLKPWGLLVLAAAVLSYLAYLYLLYFPKPSTGLLNITSLYYMRYFESPGRIFHPGLIFGVFTAVVVVWLLISRVSSARILPIIFGVFMFTASAYAVDLLYIVSHARQMQTHRISGYISDNLEPGQCVNYDVDSSGWRKMWLYPYLLYRYPLKRVSIENGDKLCSNWVISDTGLIMQRYPEATPVAAEEYGKEVLWRVPVQGGARDNQ